MPDFGQQALLSLLVNLSCIVITWWALQAINLEKFIKKGKVIQAKVLLIVLTITIASIVSNFFLNYLLWSQQLPFLF